MSGANTFGFDIALEIDLFQLLHRGLEGLFLRALREALQGSPSSTPLAIEHAADVLGVREQSGELRLMPNAVDTIIEPSFAGDELSTRNFTIRMPILASQLAVDPLGRVPARTVTVTVAGVPVTITLPEIPGIEGIEPTELGAGDITIPIAISVETSETIAFIGFALDGDVGVSLAELPTLELPAEISLDALTTTITTAIRERVAPLLQPLQVTLQPVGDPLNCDIGPREIDVMLVRQRDSSASLVVLVKALPDIYDSPPSPSRQLPASQPAQLRIRNRLLVRIVCCLLQRVPTFAFLRSATRTDEDERCILNATTDVEIFGRTFQTAEIIVAVVDGAIQISGTLRARESVGDADWATTTATFSVTLQLTQDGGVLNITASEPQVDVNYDFSVFAWLLFGFVVPLGFIALPIAEGVVDGALDAIVDPLRNVLRTLTGTPRLLPTEIVNTFGVMDLNAVTLDDLVMEGTPRFTERTYRRGAISLPLGTSFDLDSGRTVTTGRATTDFDADLLWEPVDSLTYRLRTAAVARAVAIGGLSFEGTDSITVRMLPYDEAPTFQLRSSRIPSDPARPLVFGIRTGAGRYAKCAVWRGARSRILNLRYATYDALTPIRVVREAPRELSRHESSRFESRFITYVNYQVAWHVDFVAIVQRGLAPPITWRWYYDGHELNLADGTLPGVRATYTIAGDRLTIQTEEGEDIRGPVCAMGTDTWGWQATACIPAGIEGGVREVPDPGEPPDELTRIEEVDIPGLDPGRIPIGPIDRSFRDAIGVSLGVDSKTIDDLDFL